MSDAPIQSFIRLNGVRQNNLKNFDLDLPIGKLIVVTGLSGSGKSSLAFDTLYAEGQRRYIETFSPYARQFFDRMDKPRVDSIQGIPPAIALEQRNSVKTTRSTVGTMTEITDYMKLLWPHISTLYCRSCGRPVRKDNPQFVWASVSENWPNAEVLITFQLPLSSKLSMADSLALLAKQGYQRLLVKTGDETKVLRLEEAVESLGGANPSNLIVVQDRIRVAVENRARFVEGCEQAYHFGKGRLCLYQLPDWKTLRFSKELHCAECDIEYRDPSPALFSFNNPVGACPKCKGFGRVIGIDYNLAIPNRSLSIEQGLVRPWQTGTGLESLRDLLKFCKSAAIPTRVPFSQLSEGHQKLVVEGDPDYGKDTAHEWPRAWYGVKGYFRWLESKAYKMHVRVQLAKYRCYTTCPDCHGRRFKEEALLFKVTASGGNLFTLADFYSLSVRDALRFIANLPRISNKKTDPFHIALEEVQARIGYLDEVGLAYLTLDRPTRSLSGGETERVNLTTCLGSRLVNTLFVLDEPSVGLHARDTAKLVKILQRLRDAGNTVLVVEHEPAVMRVADEIIDLGPGQGERGGQVIFQGPYSKIVRSPSSLTGAYLDGRKKIDERAARPVDLARGPTLRVAAATLHNVRNLAVDIPLNCFVVVTGVSGSGKSTLVRELLFPALCAGVRECEQPSDPEAQEEEKCAPEGSCRVEGCEHLGSTIMVDQSAIGRTPRSNPAVYIGAFDFLRDIFAESELAKQRGLASSAFSFNSSQGQCEKCRGAGFEKIEMQFLSDVFIRCSECNGRRYRPHILEVTVPSQVGGQTVAWSVADLLEATVDDALEFLGSLGDSRPAQKAIDSLKVLQEVGLGYLRLGQPINTLSGGESQRLKLVKHLAEFARERENSGKPSLFIFDEPTTGLHFQDVEVLLRAFQRLVNAGHSVLVIEHNLDVIRAADWIIDLGPEAGDLGGKLVAQGPPEEVAKSAESITASFL
ncbi:MAG TPA: excinuclease ABC subunit UvrA [Verrucomicrobiae bacterium]|nr:excinuclease ABC subunit UvrA [Verrucomicrobiae bacterium]